MKVAEKIEFLRQLFNIKNNKKLAEKVDIPYTTVLAICKGETEDIKLSTARKFCDYFDLTLDELLDDNFELPEYVVKDDLIKRKSPKPDYKKVLEVVNQYEENMIDLSEYDNDTKELILKIINMDKKKKKQ